MPEWGVATIILAWLIVVLPVVLFGAVLYPSRRVSPKLGEKASDADRTFYVIPEYVQDVHSYLAAVEAGDPQKELQRFSDHSQSYPAECENYFAAAGYDCE